MSDTAPLTFADLDQLEVTRLKGVGERKAAGLEQVGVRTVFDLITYYPRRYIDRSHSAEIGSLALGEEAVLLVTVLKVNSQRTKTGKTMVNVDVGDGTGTVRLTFFNQPWRERQLTPGLEAVVFGKLDEFRGRRQIANAVVDLVGNRTGRIVPIYPQSEKAGLSTWEIGDWVAEALRRIKPRGLADPVPAAVLARYELTGREHALTLIHEPDSLGAVEIARKRLVFDELLRMQLALVDRKRQLELTTVGVRHDIDLGVDSLVTRFWAALPYPLTGAQVRVVAEIADDLGRAHPMHRLLQGDVGAGKTVVAVSALLVAVQGGWQGALMAPTEVLAEQHHLGIRRLLEGFTVPAAEGELLPERPLRVELLTSRVTGAERKRIVAGLAAGIVDLVIGTHALIQDAISFARLGLVVIDEQHRFGVEQRAALRDRGVGEAVPDVLVMTATPIPRTAAMTVYGDLDVSVLDEMPPGRTPISTEWAQSDEAVSALWTHVRSEVAAGRQAYVVTPLIDESEKIETASAEQTFAELSAPDGELDGLAVGVLHGRLPALEKELTFEAFRAGALDVLVATTVIEVGVDVPNATIIVILGADRFGIAQLHQLRGRVGRGKHPSFCYLVSEADTPQAEARLGALVAVDGRVRPGRGGPRPTGRGHAHGRTPDRPERPEAGVAAARPDLGGPGPRRGLRPGQRGRPHRPPQPRRRGGAGSWRDRHRLPAQKLNRPGCVASAGSPTAGPAFMTLTQPRARSAELSAGFRGSLPVPQRPRDNLVYLKVDKVAADRPHSPSVAQIDRGLFEPGHAPMSPQPSHRQSIRPGWSTRRTARPTAQPGGGTPER